MEDKTFELLTKMYSEFSEFKKDITEKVQTVGNQVTKLENKLDTNSKALFDGYRQTYEKLGIMETKVDGISQKIEKQDVEIKVIKGGK